MATKVIVNERFQYDLAKWNPAEFNSSMTLYLRNADLNDVKDKFYQISSLQIVTGQNVVAEYVVFDSYSQIVYLGSQYIDETKTFEETMSITLTKTDIIDQVQRIEDQINNVIDPETLTLEELRDYKISQISTACSEDIYAGETIQLSDGSRQRFKYSQHDQLNYDELFVLALVAPEIQQFPYHANGDCQFYSRTDIITIVATLMLRKMRLVTYCNQLKQYLGTIQDRDVLLDAEYGMELPQEYADRIETLVSGTTEQFMRFLERINPQEEE